MTHDHGAWVSVRGTEIESIPKKLNGYDHIANWACMPGEYDYLLYFHGKNINETMKHVVKMASDYKWETYTYIPFWNYMNKKYEKTF